MSNNARLFLQGTNPLGHRDGLDPVFIISINREKLSDEVLNSIIEFSFEDIEKGLDTLDITISDKDMKFIDDERFKKGRRLFCRFGYVGNISEKKEMVIKEIGYSFSIDGVPLIKLTCYDDGHQLAGKKIKYTYKNKDRKIKFSEVVARIAKIKGLKTNIVETKVEHREIKQKNISDADFLSEWTKKCTPADDRYTGGYTFFVENGVLHWIPEDSLNSKPPVYSLRYGYSGPITTELAPAMSVDITDSHEDSKKGEDYRQSGIDPRDGEIIDSFIDDDTIKTQKLGDASKDVRIDVEKGGVEYRDVSGDSGTALGAQDKLPGNKGDGTNEAEAEAKHKENEFDGLEMSVTTVGIPQLVSKKIYILEGLGKRLSGRYRAKSVRHIIDSSGYNCEMEMIRNAETSKGDKTVGDKSKVNEQPVSPEKPSVESVVVKIGEEVGDVVTMMP